MNELYFTYHCATPEVDSIWVKAIIDEMGVGYKFNDQRLRCLQQYLHIIQYGEDANEADSRRKNEQMRGYIDAFKRLLSAYQNNERITECDCRIHIGAEVVTLPLNVFSAQNEVVKLCLSHLQMLNPKRLVSSSVSVEENIQNAIEFCNAFLEQRRSNVRNTKLKAVCAVVACCVQWGWLRFKNTNQHIMFLCELAEILDLLHSTQIDDLRTFEDNLTEGGNLNIQNLTSDDKNILRAFMKTHYNHGQDIIVHLVDDINHQEYKIDPTP